METLLSRHIFFVGPPLARWVVSGGPTNRWPNEQWSDNKMFFDVILCHDFLVLDLEVIKTSPMRLWFDGFLALDPEVNKTIVFMHFEWSRIYLLGDVQNSPGEWKVSVLLNKTTVFIYLRQEPPWTPREVPGANRTPPEHQWAAITGALVPAKCTIPENTWFCNFFDSREMLFG